MQLRWLTMDNSYIGKDQYVVNDLNNNFEEEWVTGYSYAMTYAEEAANRWDEQIFFGIWTHDGILMAVYDGNDWFTK